MQFGAKAQARIIQYQLLTSTKSAHTQRMVLMPSPQKTWPLSPEWRGEWSITTRPAVNITTTGCKNHRVYIMKAVRGETDTRCPCVFAKQPIMVKANPEIIDPPPLLCWGLHRIDIP